MYNTLNELAYYKGKSVMIIETSIGVSFGKTNPFIKFKFAPREDYKSPGVWDEKNVYWLSSYIDLAVFVKNIGDVAAGKLEKYEMKNPAKGVTMNIYLTKNESSGVEYVNFHYYRGDVKLNTSLIKTTEFFALYSYFKNLVDSYNTVAQTALLRYDIWWEYVGKHKQNKQSNNSYNANNNSVNNNSYNANNTNSFKKTTQPVNSAVNSMENEIDSMQTDFDFSGDVPF